MTVRLFIRSLVTVCLLAAPLAAQTPPAPDTAAAAPVRAHHRVAHRIAELRSKLKITPDESAAFEDFAQVMRDNANRMDGLAKDHAQARATLNAVDQMKAYQAMAQAHAEDMQRLVPAFSRLYATLTPDQQKLADQSFRDFGGRRGRG